ncbi:MAG: helix-turn-helix domain-containing protein [Planctomycetia bacterium]|nr:helix-turn-helix domain-containing protein [Planctomycetia bacterium]
MSTLSSTREHLRLSQEQWARLMGVARSTVSAWEGGVAEPPPAVLAAYRKLQELLQRGNFAEIEATREHLLGIVARAEREAERLNRGRLGSSPVVKLVAVSAAAIAIGLLLGYLFRDDQA